MTAWLAASLTLALVAAIGTAVLIAQWPRRLTAEEWVLHRRSTATPETRPTRRWSRVLGMAGPRRQQPDAYARLVEAVNRDLQFARVAQVASLPSSAEQFIEQLAKASITGLVVGVLIAAFSWRGGLFPSPIAPIVLFGVVGATGSAAFQYLRFRQRARQLRQSVIRHLPRVITGARMVMESGAGTPEGALAMATALYADPAADLLREAIRIKEVHKLSLEEALDQVGRRYGVEPLGQLADAFRIGRRYGTKMSEILAGFALELRREWHAAYRERITRAPVLMTIPALIFFVGPLLVLILYLVFSPLFTVLRQL